MSCTDFPSTGLIPNVTTHTVGNITYIWTGIAWESQVNVPAGELVNDLSQAYIFETVADYQASTVVFPVGKTIHLLDRGADFEVVSGTGTGNNYNIIASGQVDQSIDLDISKGIKAKAFGAVIGSLIDNSGALSAALSFGRRVHCEEAGTYWVSSGMTTPSGSGLIANKDVTIKQLDNSNIANIFSGTSVTDIYFEGIEIDLNADNQSGYIEGQQPNIGRCFLYVTSAQLVLQDCKLSDIFGTAFYCIECTEIRVDNSRLQDNVGRFSSYGLYFVRSTQVLVTDSKFFGTQNFGVAYTTFMIYARDTCSNVTVQGCYFEKAQCFFEGKTTGGAEATGTNYQLLGNIFEQPPADIATSFCSRGLIEGNVVRMSGDFGISIGDSEHIVAVGNVVQQSNTVGMSLRKCSQCTIANNIIRDPCTNWRGFTLVENQRVGIYVIGDCARNIVEGNNITDFQTSPAKMYSGIRIEDFEAGVKGDDSSWAVIGGNISFGGYSGVDIYADGVNNVVLSNYSGDGYIPPTNLTTDVSTQGNSIGDFRRNSTTNHPYYYDGIAWRVLPKLVDTPATSTSTGERGDVAWNASHFYVCNSTNVWRRVALTTW